MDIYRYFLSGGKRRLGGWGREGGELQNDWLLKTGRDLGAGGKGYTGF